MGGSSLSYVSFSELDAVSTSTPDHTHSHSLGPTRATSPARRIPQSTLVHTTLPVSHPRTPAPPPRTGTAPHSTLHGPSSTARPRDVTPTHAPAPAPAPHGTALSSLRSRVGVEATSHGGIARTHPSTGTKSEERRHERQSSHTSAHTHRTPPAPPPPPPPRATRCAEVARHVVRAQDSGPLWRMGRGAGRDAAETAAPPERGSLPQALLMVAVVYSALGGAGSRRERKKSSSRPK